MSSSGSVVILSHDSPESVGSVEIIPTSTDTISSASLTVLSIASRLTSSSLILPTSDEGTTVVVVETTGPTTAAPSTITTSFQAIAVGPSTTFTTETWSVTTSTPGATIIETITSSSTSSNSASRSSSALNTLNPVTTSSDANKPGLGSGTRMGVGIGIPLGLAILSALIYLLWKVRRDKLRKASQGGVGNSTEFHATFQKPEMDGTGKTISQLDNSRLHELEAPTTLQISELEAAHGSSEIL